MFFRWYKNFFKRKELHRDISPDNVFLDSSNLPDFNIHQFEGQIEKTISRKIINIVGFFFIIILVLYSLKIKNLQLNQGSYFALLGDSNRLEHSIIFPERGVVYDRTGQELVWNSIEKEESTAFFKREYSEHKGFSHILGYVSYPQKDSRGNYYQSEYIGKSGVEEFFNDKMGGENGLEILEKNALSDIKSQSTIQAPKNGENITLSIDIKVQDAFYGFIEELSQDVGFIGGAGIIMDVQSGEILTMVSYPEYDLKIMSEGENQEEIAKFISGENNPFLNRATTGLFTPGSIVKPFLALGVLNEDIISPYKQILSTGSISIPNPYYPDKESVFRDWKAHGLVDMRDALAVSSDIYFYEVGGGYENQIGLGIEKINKYFKDFGFSEETGIEAFIEARGVIPNPDWKARVFDGEAWNIGNTYHTSIGQYGFQVTPLQAVRAITSIANNGKLLRPTILKKEGECKDYKELDIEPEDFKIVQEGMRQAVTNGTAVGLNLPFVEISAKTGTAERGVKKDKVNSWILGFYPTEEPKYAFVVIMEEGPVKNQIGGLYVMRQLLEWMNINTPEYLD